MSIESYLQNRYDFLTPEEIAQFANNHPWLKEEKDDAIIQSFLEIYFKGIQDRMKFILENLGKVRPKPPSPSRIEEEVKRESPPRAPQPAPVDDDKFLKDLFDGLDSLENLMVAYTISMDDYLAALNEIYNVLANMLKRSGGSQVILDKRRPIQHSYDKLLVDLLKFEKIDAGAEIIYLLEATATPDDLMNLMRQIIQENYLGRVNSGFYQRMQFQTEEDRARAERAATMAAIAEARLANQNNRGMGSPTLLRGNVPPPQQLPPPQRYIPEGPSIRDQIAEYRDSMRSKTMESRRFGANVMTFDKLEQQTVQREESQANATIDALRSKKMMTTEDIERLRVEENKIAFAKRALELTNQFRRSQGKSDLAWSQNLCDVGMPHSKNMAEHKVPFGHAGFSQRAAAIRFGTQGVYENVAYCGGYSEGEIPKVIVDGWINSPGHRKNLLSNSNICGIAVYRAPDGNWYFTQLLAWKT